MLSRINVILHKCKDGIVISEGGRQVVLTKLPGYVDFLTLLHFMDKQPFRKLHSFDEGLNIEHSTDCLQIYQHFNVVQNRQCGGLYVLFSKIGRRVILSLDFFLPVVPIVGHFAENLPYISQNIVSFIFVEQGLQLLLTSVIFVPVNLSDFCFAKPLYYGITNILSLQPILQLFIRFHLFHPIFYILIFHKSIVVLDDVYQEITAFAQKQEA